MSPWEYFPNNSASFPLDINIGVGETSMENVPP